MTTTIIAQDALAEWVDEIKSLVKAEQDKIRTEPEFAEFVAAAGAPWTEDDCLWKWTSRLAHIPDEPNAPAWAERSDFTVSFREIYICYYGPTFERAGLKMNVSEALVLSFDPAGEVKLTREHFPSILTEVGGRPGGLQDWASEAHPDDLDAFADALKDAARMLRELRA